MDTENRAKGSTSPWKEISESTYTTENTPLLLITNLINHRIEYINCIIEVWCNRKAEDFLKHQSDFHREIIHPEDYPSYMSHLKSLVPGEEKELVLRLKSRNDLWEKYIFKDRIYNLNSYQNTGKAVLTLGYKQEEIKKNDATIDIPQAGQIKHPYEQLINSLSEAYCIIELIFDSNDLPVDFLFLNINPAFHKNINLENPVGKTMREISPQLEAHWLETFGKVAITGIPVKFQKQAASLGNIWLDVSSFKLGGNLSRRIAVLCNNITEKKESELALLKSRKEQEEWKKQSEELLEKTGLLLSVFDNINQAIAVFRIVYDQKRGIKDFMYLHTNEILRTHYLKFDPVGKTFLETSKNSDNLGLFEAFKKVGETKIPLDKEFLYEIEGHNNWFRITARYHESLIITSVEDISRRKLEAQKLKDAVRFKRQLVQTSPDTIIIVNLDKNKVRYINRDMLTRAGMTKKRIQGMSLPDTIAYIHPRDRAAFLEFHRKILKSSETDVFDIEFRVRTKGVEWEWFNARGKIFNRRDANWVIEYVLLVRNITEQKITQRALLNAERLSIQGEVARTFAHELRNPLASIRMATDVIRHKIAFPQKELLSNYFEILSRSTKVLDNLVSTLLNSANYSKTQLEKADLAECVDLSLEKAADRIYLTGIKVEKNYTGPYFIMADKEKLQIALLNIIVNASEATHPDQGTIKISITHEKSDFKLSIQDNGIGLEQEQIDRLFEAFYTNKATGLGIGLNSVKNILEDHDAKIEVISQPQKGTTFHILFQDSSLE